MKQINAVLSFCHDVASPAKAKKYQQEGLERARGAQFRPSLKAQAETDLWMPAPVALAGLRWTQVRPIEPDLCAAGREKTLLASGVRYSAAAAAVLGAVAGAAIRSLVLCAVTLVVGVPWAAMHALTLACSNDGRAAAASCANMAQRRSAVALPAKTLSDEMEQALVAVDSVTPGAAVGQRTSDSQPGHHAPYLNDADLLSLATETADSVAGSASCRASDEDLALSDASSTSPSTSVESPQCFVSVNGSLCPTPEPISTADTFSFACSSDTDIADVVWLNEPPGSLLGTDQYLAQAPSPRGTFAPQAVAAEDWVA